MASLNKERGSCYRIHWKFRVRVGPRTGDTIEGSLQLGRCTKAAAKGRLRQVDEWEELVKTGRRIPDCTLDEICTAWLRERELSCTAQTLARTERVLRLYRRWREARGLPSKSVDEFACREHLTAWRDHRLDHEAGRKMVANDLTTLSAFFTWCVQERYLADNPIKRVTVPRFTPQQEGTPLTRAQAGRWLRAIRPRATQREYGPRTWAEARRKRRLIVILLNTGLRNGELCAANIEDLRVDDHRRLLHVMGKGLKQRWVPLNRAALAAIRLHLRDRAWPKRGPLLVTSAGARYNVRQLSSEIVQLGRCVEESLRVNPHNLRHTFATWLARSVRDVAVVQKVLGHENVNTTLKYYVHTGGHELATATADLHGRRDRRPGAAAPPEPSFRVIPFPAQQAG